MKQSADPGSPPVYDVAGDSRARGMQIGELTASRIEHSLHSYREMFATCDISWQQACDKAMPCLDYAHSVNPDIIEELQGIAEGANTDIQSIAALNARTEILPADYIARATGLPSGSIIHPPLLNECTSLAFARSSDAEQHDKNIWLAQNWDWLGTQREALIIIRAFDQHSVNPEALWLTATEAGMLAKIGLNSHGLGITLNILRSQSDGLKTGMPIHLFLRTLLGCESVQQACEMAASVTFSSSSNIMVADASGDIASIEISPGGAKILQADTVSEDHHWLCHTNHFLHNDLQGTDAGLTGNFSTTARLDTAKAKVSRLKSLADIHALLADTSANEESICRFPDASLPSGAQIETVFAAAMNLRERELWVTGAQPSISNFHCHPL